MDYKKLIFDIDEILMSTQLLHGLKGLNEIYTFFYDETNNIRKLTLSDKGLNIEDDTVFVLGGVLHSDEYPNFNTDALFTKLKLQSNVKDVKLKHLAKGDFLDCLNSPKVNIFLRWLYESDLYIHYSIIDTFYYAIVDIIDSLIADIKVVHMSKTYADFLKDQLYLVVIIEREEFLQLFYKHNYPNVSNDEIGSFIDSLIEILNKYKDKEEFHLGITSISQMLRQAKKINKMTFIMNAKSNVLVEDFLGFYIRNIYLFPNSKHIFDEEASIQEMVEEITFVKNGREIKRFEFVNSKKNKMIQVSDIFIGLIGKCFSFAALNSSSTILEVMKTLNEKQRDSLNFLSKIRNKSNDLNPAFLMANTSLSTMKKIETLL